MDFNIDPNLLPIYYTALFILLVHYSPSCRELALAIGVISGIGATLIMTILVIFKLSSPDDFSSDAVLTISSVLQVAFFLALLSKVVIAVYFGKRDGFSIAEILLVMGWSFILDTTILWQKGIKIHQNGKFTNAYLAAMSGFAFITLLIVIGTIGLYGIETAQTRLASRRRRGPKGADMIEGDEDGIRYISSHGSGGVSMTPMLAGVAVALIGFGGWYYFTKTPDGQKLWASMAAGASAQTGEATRAAPPTHTQATAERRRQLAEAAKTAGWETPKPLPTAKPRKCDCILPGGRMKNDGSGGSYLQVTCQNGWVGPSSEAIGVSRCQ